MSRRLWLAPLLVFAVAQLVTSALVLSLARGIDAKDRLAFNGEVARTTDAVRQRIDTTVALLRGTAALFAASPEVDRGKFNGYVARLQLRERYPGVLGIGYSAKLTRPQVARVVRTMRASGVAGFDVWPDEPRDEYHSILFLEPLDVRNRAALGYDMFTNPIRREAMERARDTGRVAASGKVILVQEIDERKQAGFLIYVPVFADGTIPVEVAARREALRGYVYAPLRAEDLLQGVRGSGVPHLDFELYDGSAAPANLMRSTRTDDSPRAFAAERELDIGGRRWVMRFASRPEFEALSQRHLIPWMALGSVAASLLLAWITFVQARARRDAEAAAWQRARDAQRLEQLYAELRDADRRKDEFLAVLAHELRNPLAPIRNSLEVIRRSPASDGAVRAREIAERQVRHMVRLIDDLLDVSRITRGKIELQRRRMPLHEAIDAAVETSRPLIEQRRHTLHVGDVDRSVQVDADPERLAQVFTNLLNNAANYTPEGGRIDVYVDPSADSVRVHVRDTGIGIEPQKLQSVFGMFVQVGRSSAGGGLGIGLSLAARLVEMHGGRIDAHSDGLGRGAEFTVTLPRA